VIKSMPKFSTREALAHLGGSPAQIDRELRRFAEDAKLLSSEHSRLLREHPLQWVAVYDGKVAAAGKTLKSVMAQLRKRGISPASAAIAFIDPRERALIL
jgi:hypothetical protein